MLTSINLNNICDIPEHSTQQQAFPRMCTIEQRLCGGGGLEEVEVRGCWEDNNYRVIMSRHV